MSPVGGADASCFPTNPHNPVRGFRHKVHLTTPPGTGLSEAGGPPGEAGNVTRATSAGGGHAGGRPPGSVGQRARGAGHGVGGLHRWCAPKGQESESWSFSESQPSNCFVTGGPPMGGG